MTDTARLVVCERTGRWASALRRDWHDAAPRIHETRHRDDARSELHEARASLVIVEATVAQQVDTLRWLYGIVDEFPRASLCVVGDAGLSRTEWFWRDAGARWVHWSWRDLTPIIHVARRHLAQYPAADRTWREQLFDRLPWTSQADPP